MQLNDDRACMAVLTCHWEGKLKVWWAMKILWVSPIAVVVQAIFLEHLILCGSLYGYCFKSWQTHS